MRTDAFALRHLGPREADLNRNNFVQHTLYEVIRDFPSYLPFVTYVDNRELRKEISIAYGKKAFQNNVFDNQQNIKDIVRLRHERANLLGYASHAHFVLEETFRSPDGGAGGPLV